MFIVKRPEQLKMLTQEEEELAKSYAKLRYDEYDQHLLRDLHKEFRGLDGVENVLGKPVEGKKDYASKRIVELTQKPRSS